MKIEAWIFGLSTAFFVAAVLLRAGTELLRAFEGGLVMFAVYLLVNLFSPKGMGMGCVKFAFVVGFIPASRAGVWYSSV